MYLLKLLQESSMMKELMSGAWEYFAMNSVQVEHHFKAKLTKTKLTIKF